MARPSTRDNAIRQLIDGTAHLDAEGRGVALTVLLRALDRAVPTLALSQANAAIAATNARTLAEVLSKLPADLAEVSADRAEARFPFVDELIQRHTRVSELRRAAAHQRWSRQDDAEHVEEPVTPTAPPAPTTPTRATSPAPTPPAPTSPVTAGSGGAPPSYVPPGTSATDLFDGTRRELVHFPRQRQATPSGALYRQLMTLVSEIGQRKDWTGDITQTRRGISRLWSTTYRDTSPSALLSAVTECRDRPDLPERLVGWITTVARDYAANAPRPIPVPAPGPRLLSPANSGDTTLGLSAGSLADIGAVADRLGNLDSIGAAKS